MDPLDGFFVAAYKKLCFCHPCHTSESNKFTINDIKHLKDERFIALFSGYDLSSKVSRHDADFTYCEKRCFCRPLPHL